MFYICISIVSTRSTQWWSPICILSTLIRPVWSVWWPVCTAGSATGPTTGRTASTGRSDRLASPYQSDLPILTVNACPLFRGKACIPRNIYQNQNCTGAMSSTSASNMFHFSRTIVSIGHITWFCSIWRIQLVATVHTSCVSDTSQSTYCLGYGFLKY